MQRKKTFFPVFIFKIAAKFGECQYMSGFSPIWVIGTHDSGAMTHCVPLAWSKCIKLGFHNTKDPSNLQKRDSVGWRGLGFINLAHLCHPGQKTKFAELTFLLHRKTLNYFSKKYTQVCLHIDTLPLLYAPLF